MHVGAYHIVVTLDLIKRWWPKSSDKNWAFMEAKIKAPGLCPNGPEFALLLIGIDSIPSDYRTVICNILYATRLAIARK